MPVLYSKDNLNSVDMETNNILCHNTYSTHFLTLADLSSVKLLIKTGKGMLRQLRITESNQPYQK